ncbi:hypothetical protein F4811DRAFT_572774 [Daldinia bambusicola]|nr:hypothetical protein F4811DRAFT_572774 [Daldinia bambusicola]
MSVRAEILSSEPSREYCNIRGSFRQRITDDTSMTTATDEKGQAPVGTSVGNTSQIGHDTIGTIHIPGDPKPHFEQANEFNNHTTCRDGDTKRPTHHTYLSAGSPITQTCTNQQLAYNSNYKNSRDIASHIEGQTEEVDIPVSLQQYLSGQQIVGNYTLEFWMAEALSNGPLRVIPQLINPANWPLQIRTDSGHSRESDVETIRGETLNEIHE